MTASAAGATRWGRPAAPSEHADRPRGDQQAVAEAPGAQHVGDEERLRGRRDGEHREGGDRAAERDREGAVAREEDEAVAGADARRREATGRRRARSAQARERDGHERQRVDGQREPQLPGRAEHAAEQRAGGEAERAHALHQPVGAGDLGLTGRGGHERELRGLADRDGEAEQRDEHAAPPRACSR